MFLIAITYYSLQGTPICGYARGYFADEAEEDGDGLRALRVRKYDGEEKESEKDMERLLNRPS